MRGLKLLILILLGSLVGSAQYVQPMGYKDYSFYGQVNIGNAGTKLTHPSAYLELGKASGSDKGFLMPRGVRGSIISPAVGLQIYDLVDKKPYYFNGTQWMAIGESSYKVDSLKFRNDSVFYYKNGGVEYYAGFVGTDSSIYATRSWVNSQGFLKAIPSWDQTLAVSNTSTRNATTTGTITGGNLQTTNGKVTLWNAGGNGIGDFMDNAGNIHTSINMNYGGNVSTGRIEFNPVSSAPTAPATNTGFIYVKTGGTPYFYYNGVENPIVTGTGVDPTQFVQNQNSTGQTANFNITGSGTIGGTLNVKGKATFDSTVIFASEAVAPPVVNGGQFYNTTTGKMQIGEGGVWKNALQDFVTGKTIYVDYNSPNATDTRGGLSKYDFNRPFNTLQNAINAAAAGDVIFVKNSNTGAGSNLTATVSLTILAESRITVGQFSINGAAFGATFTFINVDFGTTSNPIGDVIQTNSVNPQINFFNCTFISTGGLFISSNSASGGGGLSLNFCYGTFRGTGNLTYHPSSQGYGVVLNMLNSTIVAPGKIVLAGAGSARSAYGKIYNSYLNADRGYSGVIMSYVGNPTIVNSLFKAQTGAFFSFAGNGANGYPSDLLLQGSQILSATTDVIGANDGSLPTNGYTMTIEGCYFAKAKIILDSVYSNYNTTLVQTAKVYNNQFGEMELYRANKSTLVWDGAANTARGTTKQATDASFSINTYSVLLPNVTANRVITLPEASIAKGSDFIIINRNTTGFTWSTNVSLTDLDGTTFTTLANATVYRIQSDGANWNIINN